MNLKDKNRVLFPLRSNVAWFLSQDLREAISNRVKEALLIFDELYFEDGTYVADILEHGSFDTHLPPGSISPDLRKIECDRDLKETNMELRVGPQGQPVRETIMKGRTIARFKVDYYEIFRDSNLSGHDFIKFIRFRLTNDSKKIIAQESSLDKHALKEIHPNTFYRDLVIKNLNTDIVGSVISKAALALDPMHTEILKRKCTFRGIESGFTPSKEGIAVNHLISVAAPNLMDTSIQEIINLREDDLWRAFREFVRGIVTSVKAEPLVLTNPDEIANLVKTKVGQALFKELERKHTTGFKLGVDIGLGFTSLIPGFGCIPTLIGVESKAKEYFEDKSGWLAFLLKLTSKQ